MTLRRSGPAGRKVGSWALLWIAGCLTVPLGGQPQPSRAQPPTAPKTDGRAFVTQAYTLSQTAKEKAEFAKIIELCQQGMTAGLPADSLKYAKELCSWSHNRRGQILLDDGAVEQALADFETSIQLDAARWRPYHNRGFCLAMLGEYDKALDDFDKTIKLNPQYAKAYFNRAEIFFLQERHAEALADYTKALQWTPEDSETYNRRGYVYYRLGNSQQAVTDFNQALRLDPKNSSALVNRGDLFGDLGQLEQAARDYREAIRVDAKSDRAYVSAAWMMATCPEARYRNPSLAVDSAKRALELIGDGEHPYRHRYLEVLAAAQANAGKFEEAAKTQAEATKLAPPEDQARFQERQKLYASGQPYRDALRPPTEPGQSTKAQPSSNGGESSAARNSSSAPSAGPVFGNE